MTPPDEAPPPPPGPRQGPVTDVIIVGAGLTGLACARSLVARGLSVHLLESGPRIGGVVGTVEVGGFLFETGPTAVPAGAEHLRRAAADLDIDGELVVARPEARRRYLFRDGGLHPVPRGPRELLRTPLLSRRARLQVLAEPLRRFAPPPGGASPDPEPTFGEFLAERLGAEAARTFARVFAREVRPAKVDTLGAASAFPELWSLACEHGGLVRAALARERAARQARRRGAAPLPGPAASGGDLLSFSDGFHVLVDAYARALEGRVSRNTTVVEIDRGPGGWRAVLETGDALACRELVLAVPAPHAHPLVAMCAPERLELGGLLRTDHAAVTAVHLGLEGAPLPPGSGFLVPADEEAGRDPRTPRVLEVVFVSNLFAGRAPSGTSSVACLFRGGDVAALDHDRLVDRAVVELEKALIGYEAVDPRAPRRPGRPRVVASHVQRWTDVVPSYRPGHRAMCQKLDWSVGRMLPGLHLAGSHSGGVSVDDRIRVGTEVAERVAARLAHLGARAPRGAARTGEAS